MPSPNYIAISNPTEIDNASGARSETFEILNPRWIDAITASKDRALAAKRHLANELNVDHVQFEHTVTSNRLFFITIDF